MIFKFEFGRPRDEKRKQDVLPDLLPARQQNEMKVALGVSSSLPLPIKGGLHSLSPGTSQHTTPHRRAAPSSARARLRSPAGNIIPGARASLAVKFAAVNEAPAPICGTARR